LYKIVRGLLGIDVLNNVPLYSSIHHSSFIIDHSLLGVRHSPFI
jgi:hypothetical protein